MEAKNQENNVLKHDKHYFVIDLNEE